jgi:hypothetical protein
MTIYGILYIEKGTMIANLRILLKKIMRKLVLKDGNI